MHRRRRTIGMGVGGRLIFLGFILVIVGILTVGYFLLRTWGKDWVGDSRVTGVLMHSMDDTRPLTIWSYQASEGLILIPVPKDMMMSVAHEYGSYQADKLYPLAMQENNIQILLDTLTLQVHYPVENYFVGLEEGCSQTELECLRRYVRSGWLNPNTVSSNLDRKDRLGLWLKMLEIKEHHVQIIPLDSSKWAESALTIDGLESVTVNNTLAGARLAPILKDVKIIEEQLSLEIVNTTGVTGMGTRMADILLGMGGRVIQVGDSSEVIETCLLKVNSSAQSSYTLEVLSRVWKCEVLNTEAEDERVDVQILIGKSVINRIST